MLLLLQKVVHEDDHEHSGHDEIKSLGVERKKSAEQAAQQRQPIEQVARLNQQRHQKCLQRRKG